MIRTLVVAMARNRVIGRDNQLPWRLPDEIAYFKRVTMGHPIVMGRRTYESIGKPLPGRKNIVVTHDRGYQAPGCTVVGSLGEAWQAAGNAHEVCVIGGTSLFRESLPIADRIHLTVVEADVPGDTYFRISIVASGKRQKSCGTRRMCATRIRSASCYWNARPRVALSVRPGRARSAG